MSVVEEAVSGGTASQRTRAQAICLRQLAARARSRAELERALQKRDIDAEVARQVLDEFAGFGYIDDEAYAVAVVRNEHSNRGMARRAIAERLRQRGVDDEIVERALSAVEPAGELATARELASKRLRLMSGLDSATKARRLQGYLLRRGYSPGLVVALSRELVQ